MKQVHKYKLIKKDKTEKEFSLGSGTLPIGSIFTGTPISDIEIEDTALNHYSYHMEDCEVIHDQ